MASAISVNITVADDNLDVNNLLQSGNTLVPNKPVGAPGWSGMASQALPYVLSLLGAGGKAGSALAGKLSPSLGALFLSKPAQKFYNRKTGLTSYSHDIFDDTRPQVGSVGTIELLHDPRSDHIHVQSIDAAEPTNLPINHPAAAVNQSSQVFGSSNIKTLLRSLQQQYPYAKTIGGDRISGARWLGAKSSDDDVGSIRQAIMKLPETPERKADRLYQEELWQKRYGGNEQ